MVSVRPDEEDVMKSIYASKLEEVAARGDLKSREKCTLIKRLRYRGS